MAKVLFLQKRGGDCEALADIKNYRVVTAETVRGKDGNVYFLEFTRCDKWHYRTENKRTGAPLKKAVRELVKADMLHLDTCYEGADGIFRRNSYIESVVWDANRDYNLYSVLAVVNFISADPFDRVEFVN